MLTGRQVSLRYFSMFDFCALCCGFGDSGGVFIIIIIIITYTRGTTYNGYSASASLHGVTALTADDQVST